MSHYTFGGWINKTKVNKDFVSWDKTQQWFMNSKMFWLMLSAPAAVCTGSKLN